MPTPRPVSRRDFLRSSAALLATAPFAFAAGAATPEPIIDIHQHTSYGGGRDKAFNPILPAPRTDADLVAHQRGMGVTKTILLPAGRPVLRLSTLQGKANGLDGTCTSNDACVALARQHPGEIYFGANEVSDLDEAPATVEKYLKLGAVVIGEQKFGVECDSPAMQRLYALAAAYRVPILLHWQTGSYNHGFERFHRMLEKFPQVSFIGHAQTWWANIDAACVNDAKNLYPRGKVTPGGLTDRYLRDYPNMYGDLSAGSGLNAFVRDPEHGRAFLARHQDKLLYGSDCNDASAEPVKCSGIRQIAQIRQLAPSPAVARKLLFGNASKLFRL
jgi:predicted TIM-barrel fold metal-dependent hydrolase